MIRTVKYTQAVLTEANKVQQSRRGALREWCETKGYNLNSLESALTKWRKLGCPPPKREGFDLRRKQILDMFFIERLTPRQIADRTGMTRHNVDVALRRWGYDAEMRRITLRDGGYP